MDPGRKENTASLQPAELSRYTQLFTITPGQGLPTALPLPMAFSGSYSPDGQRMVYAPLDGGQFGRTPARWVAWNRYRGGEASYLWIINFADLSIEKIPRADSNDINPMWVGNKVYFLSDRNGPMTLFGYEPATNAVTELIKSNGTAIRAASAGPGRDRLRAVRADPALRPDQRKEPAGAHRDRCRRK